MRRAGMLEMYAIAGTLLVIIVLLIAGVISQSRKQPLRQVGLDIDDDLLPGQELPRSAFCEWHHYSGEDTVYCGVYRGGAYAGLTVDKRTNRIRHTYYSPAEKFSVGELLLSVGEPVWMKRTGRTIQLGWPDGNITLSWARTFRPETPVMLFILGEDVVPENVERWQGFVNR